MKRAWILLALAACAAPPPIEDMEPAPGPGVYDVGDVNLRAALPFDPADPPEHLCLSPTVALPYWGIGFRIGDWEGGSGASLREVSIDEFPNTTTSCSPTGRCTRARGSRRGRSAPRTCS